LTQQGLLKGRHGNATLYPGEFSMKLSIKRIIHEDYKQVIFVFLAFLAMVLISYFFASDMVERYMDSNAERMLAITESRINAKFTEAKLLVLVSAFSVRNRLESGYSLEEIERYLQELTEWLHSSEGDLDFISVFGIFNGKFVDGQRWTPPDDFRPEERPWAIAARAGAGNVVYTTPYVNALDGRLVVSASMVLRGKNGQNHGIIGYNMIFRSITNYVTDLQFSEGGYGMLLGPDFEFIVHPDDYYVGRQMDELSRSHAAVVEKFQSGVSRSSMVKLMNNQGTWMAAFFRRMENGWYIGVANPMKSYHRDLSTMALALSVVGAVLMAALSYTLVKMTMAKIHSDEENKSKTSFLARMSHEIRTPMNTILGISEILLRKNISGEISEYISIIRQSGNTLLSIINDILDFSKIESGHTQIEAKEYSFASLINDVINVIRMRVVDKPIDFFVTVDSRIPAVLVGDDARIRQILINLLNNAVNYTRKGHISCDVEMKRIDAHKIELFFHVTDTGIGIREADILKLFSDFSRVDMDHNQNIEGTGLGLAIAKNLCTAMGGRIVVSSEYGKGSTFTASVMQICLDDRRLAFVEGADQKRVLVHEERPHHAAALRSALENLHINAVYTDSLSAFIRLLEEGDFEFAFVSSRYAMDCIPVWGKRGNTLQLIIMTELGEIAVYRDTGSVLMPIYSIVIANILNGVIARGCSPAAVEGVQFTAPWAAILIVDDISTNLRVAAELMAPYQMKIDTCINGEEAVEMVKNKRYDLVFMDHMMPGMDGIEATKLIRKINDSDEYYRNLPVIMLTANAVFGQREMFLENGVNDFLAKPIETQKLNAVLKKWLPESKRRENSNAISLNAENQETTERIDLELPGVIVSDGLFNVGGSLPVYLDILAIFCRDALDRVKQITDALAVEDFGLYTTLVHALKSAARSIGARELGDAAAELEEAGRTRNTARINEKTGPFLEDLKTLSANISDLVSKTSAAGEIAETVDVSALRLETLKEALITMDIETINQFMLEYSAMSLDAATKDLVNKIKEDVLLFEYDRAVEKIQNFLGV
jgi:signal transduction histidine kinase/CheY-like chemotaxis protein/HPt (histidine-containing phosphotransfer) domain-containing protein